MLRQPKSDPQRPLASKSTIVIEERQLLKLMGVTVTVKETVQYRCGNDLALELIVGRWGRFMKTLRDMLVNALMGSLLIEVVSVSQDDSVQLVGV